MVLTPFDHSQRLIKYDGVSKSVDKAECQSLVGSFVYAAVATRPDISHSVEYQISTNYYYMRRDILSIFHNISLLLNI